MPTPIRTVIPLPVVPRVHVRSRTFSVTPVPDKPGHYNWGCQDCAESDCATSEHELGDHLAEHLKTCPG